MKVAVLTILLASLPALAEEAKNPKITLDYTEGKVEISPTATDENRASTTEQNTEPERSSNNLPRLSAEESRRRTQPAAPPVIADSAAPERVSEPEASVSTQSVEAGQQVRTAMPGELPNEYTILTHEGACISIWNPHTKRTYACPGDNENISPNEP